jgi:RHS repeat-associated protein
MAVVDNTGTNVVARYEYSPFGEVLSATGSQAASNNWRFSSKYFDPDTGLGYWGFRWYDAKNGRWLGRDPIQENGGENLYGYLGNDSQNSVDLFGLGNGNPISGGGDQVYYPEGGWISVNAPNLPAPQFKQQQSIAQEPIGQGFLLFAYTAKGGCVYVGQASVGAVEVLVHPSMGEDIPVEGGVETAGRKTGRLAGGAISFWLSVNGLQNMILGAGGQATGHLLAAFTGGSSECIQVVAVPLTALGAAEASWGAWGLNNYSKLDDITSFSQGKGSGKSQSKEYPRDKPTEATKDWSAEFKSEGEARALAKTKLGEDPVQVELGKWRSRNGKWQYRAKPGDVTDRHIHLEELNPETGEVIQNVHLRWVEGAGR